MGQGGVKSLSNIHPAEHVNALSVPQWRLLWFMWWKACGLLITGQAHQAPPLTQMRAGGLKRSRPAPPVWLQLQLHPPTAVTQINALSAVYKWHTWSFSVYYPEWITWVWMDSYPAAFIYKRKFSNVEVWDCFSGDLTTGSVFQSPALII